METPANLNLQAKRGASYEEWFLHEVDEVIAEADRGKLVEHSDVPDLIDKRYPR